MKYWERRMRYGRLLEDKKEEWQNKQEERFNHMKETKKAVGSHHKNC
jgi:hypothetical protein